MINRTTKLRWRRGMKHRRQQVEDMGVQAEEQLEQHFFKRFGRLARVRRFVISWVLLVTLLIIGTVTQIRGLSQYFQTVQPAPGGTFTEGVVGVFTNANPLYAASAADAAVSHLVFSGLMRYDEGNNLVGDLAEAITVDESGIKYTVTLRPDLRWQDGRPLTSADVAFTYRTIQNPDARSPLAGGWKGITIETPSDRTVVFTLPNVLSGFPYALTTGIVPEHALKDVPVAQLRTTRFNTAAPVGSGPFKWDVLEVKGLAQEEREERIGLVPNEHFYRGKAKLDNFIVRTFRDEKRMLEAYRAGELSSMSGLTSLPDTVRDSSDVREYTVSLTGAVMAFFKTTQEPLNDVKIRRALVHAVDVPATIQPLGYPVVVVKGPLLNSHLGFDKNATQLPFDKAEAEKLLTEAGWVPGKDGIRFKEGRPLTFRLYAQSTSEYATITNGLQKAWRSVGVDAQVLMLSDSDIQGVVSRHDYDALLYGISLGTDPDVFAYWHSSQADPASPNKLNLSEYKSSPADRALESGRTRADTSVRAAKYKPFLDAWRVDAPALALYQPPYLYVTRGPVYNFNPKIFNSTTDRFSNVENWMIRQEKVTK